MFCHQIYFASLLGQEGVAENAHLFAVMFAERLERGEGFPLYNIMHNQIRQGMDARLQPADRVGFRPHQKRAVRQMAGKLGNANTCVARRRRQQNEQEQKNYLWKF